MRTEIHTGVLSQPAAIAVADGGPRTHETLDRAMRRQSDLRVVASYHTSQETWQSVRQRCPQVLFLDWRLPDTGGMTLLRRLDPGPELNVILLTDEKDPGVLAEALIHGARGAVSRTAHSETLLRCTRAVLAGELWFSRAVTRALRDRIISNSPVGDWHGVLENVLTPREREVARCVASGSTNQKVATDLGISHQTVRHHLKSVFAKLQVSSRLELALLAESDRPFVVTQG